MSATNVKLSEEELRQLSVLLANYVSFGEIHLEKDRNKKRKAEAQKYYDSILDIKRKIDVSLRKFR